MEENAGYLTIDSWVAVLLLFKEGLYLEMYSDSNVSNSMEFELSIIEN